MRNLRFPTAFLAFVSLGLSFSANGAELYFKNGVLPEGWNTETGARVATFDDLGWLQDSQGIAFNSRNSIYVASHPGDSYLTRFSFNGSGLWELASYFRRSGGEFQAPRGVAVNGSGNVLVAAQNDNKIWTFGPDSETFDDGGVSRLQPTPLGQDSGVRVSANGQLQLGRRADCRFQIQ